MVSSLKSPAPEGPPTASGVAALPEILSPAQAAWMLQITPGRLEAAAKRGDVPYRGFGTQRIRRVYSKTALLELIRNAS